MPERGATRQFDSSLGHKIGSCYWPPTIMALPYVTDVYVDDLLAGSVGAGYVAHKGVPCKVWHKPPQEGGDRALVQGSSTVFVDDQPMSRIGDIIGDGDFAAQGSSTVFVGD